MASCNSGNKKMNTVIKTTFAGKSPFKALHSPIDIGTIKITNDKPKVRRPTNYKYESIFTQLDIGKSLACLPQDCDKIGQALRDYIRRNELNWTVKVQSSYSKTSGRVFVIAKEKK
jgi:hypothetical protein